ncbi:MAG TPA: metallophosphoesterase family protein, partial [Gemmatimonadaceae bacterium]
RIRAFAPETRVCIVGHTHRAGATYVSRTNRVRVDEGARVSLDGDGIWFVNPGSVGEPRDGDPRASYAILDWPPRHVAFHRARYDRPRLAKLNALRMPPVIDRDHNAFTVWLDQAAARLDLLRE